MAYEPLHHKYRPQTFAQLVGQAAIAATLTNALRQSRIAPAYLFCGPRGTGKTSSARILAKSLNCVSASAPTPDPCGTCETCVAITKGAALDVIEIDAASNTGVDNIRDLIERAQFAPVQCRYKVYIIDEVHMLSTAAFNALLKTLEEPPERVVFVLATTDPQRVLATIISRCQRFDFRRIPLGSMTDHLQHIAAQEAIAISPAAVALVAQISQGGLRDAESLLDQLSLAEGKIEAETVWDLVGAVPERELLSLSQAIAADDGAAVLERARHLMDRGREPLVVLQNLASFFRDLLVAKTAPTRRDLVAVTDETWEQMKALVQALALPTILQDQQRLRESEVQVKSTTQPRLWLEVTLLGLLPSSGAAATAATQEASPPPAPAKKFSAPPAAPPAPPPPAAPPRAVPPPSQPEPATSAASPLPEPVVPEVTASTPPVTEAAPIATPSPDTAELAQIWRDVLQYLRPPGTQALLDQHGHLVSLEGTRARVGVVSAPLMKMAEQRTKNIEAAFEAALNAQISVSFQIASLPAPSNTPTPPAQSVPAPPQTALPRVSPPPPADVAPAVSTPPSPAASANLSAADDGDRTRQAVKSFADFFNGKVAEVNEEIDTFISTPPPADTPPTVENGEPDFDVPF
ncbi:MAG: DNA polymerase III subunit gamma/tau [Cyanobacteria bacterium P01_A01_bin.135]